MNAALYDGQTPTQCFALGQIQRRTEKNTVFAIYLVAQGHEAKVTTMQQVQCTVTLYYGSTTMMKTTEN